MGEIDRIPPIAPITGPRPTDRVQPGHDRRQPPPHEHKQDELELTNVLPDEDSEEEEAEVIELPHGFDIAI